MGCLEIWDATMCFLYEKKWQDSVEAAVVWAGWVTAVFMEPVGRGGQLGCPRMSIGGMAVIHAVHAFTWGRNVGRHGCPHSSVTVRLLP